MTDTRTEKEKISNYIESLKIIEEKMKNCTKSQLKYFGNLYMIIEEKIERLKDRRKY